MRKRYIVTILTALAIVAYLALDDHQSQQEPLPQELIDQEPDYIVEGLDAASYDEEGFLKQEISAIKATHFPVGDVTLLEQPAVILHESNTPKWGIRSDSGRLLKQSKIILSGSVIIVPLQPGSGDFSLTTESLDIDLERQMADTEDKVIIESDTSELYATGMSIFLDRQYVEFKSQVRGRHDPKAK